MAHKLLGVPKITTVTVILPGDDAIGLEADYNAYQATGDESHLKLVGVPTRYHVRPLTRESALDAAAAAGVPHDQIAQYAASASLMREQARLLVCDVTDPDPGAPKAIQRRTGRSDRVLSYEYLEQMAFEDLMLILLAARQLAETTSDLKKK